MKTSETINMDPERFRCILSHTSMKQSTQKRLYLQTLPFYINDRESRKLEVEDNGAYTAPSSAIKRCPPRKIDAALD